MPEHITPRNSWELTDSKRIQIEAGLKSAAKAALLEYYGQMVEFGRPDHIITLGEATQLFKEKGLIDSNNENSAKSFLASNFSTKDFNRVLFGLKLPHKKFRSHRDDY